MQDASRINLLLHLQIKQPEESLSKPAAQFKVQTAIGGQTILFGGANVVSRIEFKTHKGLKPSLARLSKLLCIPYDVGTVNREVKLSTMYRVLS